MPNFLKTERSDLQMPFTDAGPAGSQLYNFRFSRLYHGLCVIPSVL